MTSVPPAAVEQPPIFHVEAERTPLQEAVDVLTDVLLSHLAYEERELVEKYGYKSNSPDDKEYWLWELEPR